MDMDLVSTIYNSYILPIIINVITNKFSNNLPSTDKSLLENEISEIYHSTIRIFNEKYKNEKHCDFLEKQVVLEELFKFRYLEGYIIDKDKLHDTLNNYQEYLTLNEEQIEFFFNSLDIAFKNNPKLKNLYINANFREEIFYISKAVDNIQNNVIKILQKMDDNFQEGLKDPIIMLIKDLKVQTALNLIQNFEDKYNSNPSNFSNDLVGEIFLLKGYCQKIQFNFLESYKSFINAYNYNKENIKIIREACFSYFKLNNIKHEELMDILYNKNQYDPIYWAIKIIKSKYDFRLLSKESFFYIIKDKEFISCCYSECLFNQNSDLVEFGTKFEIYNHEEITKTDINGNTINYYIFIMDCYLSKLIKESREQNIAIYDIEHSYLYSLLDNLNSCLLKSELMNLDNSKMIFFLFWLFKYFKENNEDNMQVLLNHFNELNNVDELTAVLMTKAIMKSGRFLDGVALINKNGHFNNEYLIYSKNLFHFLSDNNPTIIYNYFNEITEINDNNIQFVLDFALISLRKDISIKDNVLEIITKKKMAELNKKQLILFINSFSENEPLSLDNLNSLTSMFNKDNLYYYFANILFNHKMYYECVDFLVKNGFEYTNTQEFDLIIKSLIHENQRSRLLLDYLIYWRLNYEGNEYYLLKEIVLLSVIDRWDDVYDLSKNFINNNSNSPYYDPIKYNYIMSIVNLSKIEEIKHNANAIIDFNYSDENQIKYIVQHLFLKGLTKLSLDLLFKNANNKNNKNCRAYFFAKHIDYISLYKEYDMVEFGSNVVYQANDSKYQMKINNSNDKIQREFIGKKKGDFVKMKLLSQKEYSVEIIAICDDYIALFYELLNESLDPANSLGVEVIIFDEKNPEEFKNTILTMSKEKRLNEDNNESSIDLSIDLYKNKKISLWELSCLHFNGSYFQSLYFLNNYNTCIQNEDIQNFFNTQIYNNYFLDLPSSFQLYNICIEFNIKVEKFFISHSVLNLIKKELYQLNDKLNVESTIYSDGTDLALIQNQKDLVKESRKKILQFERWLKDNTFVQTPQEKLEIPPQKFKKFSLLHEYAIDYVILSRIPNTVIVTDDFSFGFYKNHCKNTMSFLQYISTIEIDNLNDVVSFINGGGK